MKKPLIILFIFLFHAIGYTQIENLTSEERAYLYHIVKKSPILDYNIGRYFHYSGPEIRYSQQKLNYDSIETYIINQPDLLTIYTSEIAKSPVGIVAEATNKTAIWELNKVLLSKRSDNEKEFEVYKNRYNRFLDTLIKFLPEKALKTDKNGQINLQPKVEMLLNPSLSLNDKVKMMETFRFLNTDEQLKVLNGIYRAINVYVSNRSYEIFLELGGQTFQYQNILVAAGDGSLTSGLLEEREKDERGRWNKGLPKAIGLFPYQLFLKEKVPKDESAIQPKKFAITDCMTSGNNLQTNVHMDVWGYNSKKQTTVVIERNGKSYHLFGAKDTRFLSPDSTFSGGATFQSIINELKAKIADLDEKIYGKKGYDYWIRFYEQKATGLQLDIQNLEQEISYISGYHINTQGRDKNAKAGELSNTKSNKKDRQSAQQMYVQKNEDLETCKKKIQALKKEKEEALALKEEYNTKMVNYIEAFGRNWVPYTVKGNTYTYADSCTYNIMTQDFTFPAKKESEAFEVRLLSIPNTAKSDLSDEVMLHINVTSSKPNYDARIQLTFNDFFKSNEWLIDKNILQPTDSISIHVFMEQLLDKKKNFNIVMRGNGIGKWNDVLTTYNPDQIELENYPSEGAKEDSTFKRLRVSYVDVYTNDNDILLEINSYTDPVKTKFTISNDAIQKIQEKNKLTYNQILSGYRTANILFKLQDELNLYAGKNFTREEAKIIIDRINSTIGKSNILIGQESIKTSLFK